ncbi:MAG: hypothetical protein ACREM8_08010, partial [Vulcanimicrobiaceae bacterium]
MQGFVIDPGARRRIFISTILVVSALVAIWFASLIPHTIAIFVLGAFIALSVRPVVVWLERYMQRALALAIVYAGLVGA